MQLKKLFQGLVMTSVLLGAGASAQAQNESNNESNAETSETRGLAGALGISGDAGYYTYGMNDINARLNGGQGALHGGMGYGGALKFNLTNRLAAKAGIDYLFASTPSSRVINGATVDTQVNLPATMIFLGGEYTFLPLSIVHIKLIAGYTLVSIFNGDEKSTSGNSLDMGTVSGSGSGAQAGVGAEVFLARGFSLEADLAYNLAKISGATFAGSPALPSSSSVIGTVDYSGLVAKLAFTIYLIP